MPYNQKDQSGKIRNFTPITKIFTRNDIAITRDGDGKISSILIDDGDNQKLMTISRDGDGRIQTITTTP